MSVSSNVILTPGRLAETVEYFRKSPEGILSFDLETSGDNRGVPFCNSASWIGLAARGRVAVIPFGHPIGSKVVGEARKPQPGKDGKLRTTRGGKLMLFREPIYEPPPAQMERAEVFSMLRPLFYPARKDEAKTLIGHGMQFDLATIAKYYDDEIPPGPHCDTIVLRWLIDENRKQYGLKAITKDIYKFSYDDENVGKCVEKYPFNKVAHYLYCDVIFPLYEYRRLRPQIDREDLQQVYELEMALLPVLARMRLTGVRVDTARLEEMRADLSVRVEQVEGEIYAAAGRKFNINAPRAKCEILYKPKSEVGQGLKAWRLTDGGKKRRDARQELDHLRLQHRLRGTRFLCRQPRGRRAPELPGVVQDAAHVRLGLPG